MPGFHLPVYDLINDGSLFGRSFAEINAGGFDTFVSHKIGEESNVVAAVKAKLFCPEIAGLFCRIAGLFCHDSRANLSLKPVCFGIAIS